MTWQKWVSFVQGSEVPRGLVSVWLITDSTESGQAADFDWSQVERYALPDTEAGHREAPRIRKANSRAAVDRLDMPMPKGTAAALGRVARAAGFEDRREWVAWMIHRLDVLATCDRAAFLKLCEMTVTAGDLSKFMGRIGAPEVDEDA